MVKTTDIPMDEIYCDLMLFASGVIAALSLVLASIPVPDSREFRKIRKARTTLAASFLILSVLNFTSFLTGYEMELDRLNTLIVSSFQALLISGTLLVFIRPDVVTGKWVAVQIATITAISALLYVLIYLAPGIYGPFFCLAAGLFVLQLVLYSLRFFKSLKKTLKETNDYYAEECSPRLKWIRSGFILMLVIGVAALFTLVTGPWFYMIFVPAYLVCYTFAALCTLTYVGKMSFILPAISHEEKTEEPAEKPVKAQIPARDVAMLKERVGKWVAEGKYRERDVPYKDILAGLDTDAATMRAFMKSEYGMDFRTWRNRLRLSEACRLLMEHPELKAEQISRAVGYGDSSNFHTDFKKLTGMSTGEWRKTPQNGKPDIS